MPNEKKVHKIDFFTQLHKESELFGKAKSEDSENATFVDFGRFFGYFRVFGVNIDIILRKAKI